MRLPNDAGGIAVFIHPIDELTHLQLLEDASAEPLFICVDRNRTELSEWLHWPGSIRSAEDLLPFIAAARRQWLEGRGFTAAIVHQSCLCGIVGHNEYNRRNRHISLGYWLDRDHQGKGLMTKACSALIDYAFGRMKLRRVEIRTAAQNFRSRAVPERLGFTEEGIVREAAVVNGRCVDHVIYGLLNREWITTS